MVVETLIEPGVDPHTFDMTPGDIRAIVDADIVLINGLDLDEFISADALGADSDANIVTVTDGIELLESGSENHDNHDPHVWHDPLRVQEMVANIAASFTAADPDNAEFYQDNAAGYHDVLDETDRQIRARIDQIPSGLRKIVTNHDAFGYFAARYDIDIVGTVIPGGSSEAEPSAAGIADLTNLIEREGVRVIFAEALLDPTVAEALAADTGVEIVYGLYADQLGADGSGAETVHGMLLANAELISDALEKSLT